MKRIIICLLALASFSQAVSSKWQSPAPPPVVFTNVNVIPLDRERVLENQTVIVRNGRIAELGPADKVKVPEGAQQVAGRGKYLLPGLVDMHVHIGQGAGQPADSAGRTILLLLANGVTTARSMIGHPDHLALRDKLAKSEILGPTLYAGSPPLYGSQVNTPEVARKTVLEYKQAGFDFIKLITGFTPEVYDALTAAARAAQIPVAGHVELEVGLSRAIAARQQLEHLDAWLEAIVKDNAPVKRSHGQLAPGRILFELDESKIPKVAATIRDAGVWTCPTLELFKRVASDETVEELAAQPALRYVSPQAKTAWGEQRKRMMNDAPPPEERKRFIEIRNRITKELHRAGAKLLAGSDSPNFFRIVGFAIHGELKALVEAGLSPYAALEAATRNPAEYLQAAQEFGTVELGKRADLLLVEANPLTEIGNLQKRAGVMVRGGWLPESELKKLLDEVAASAQAQPPPKSN
jgi:imidazolonepropionase-like amidohydrolase